MVQASAAPHRAPLFFALHHWWVPILVGTSLHGERPIHAWRGSTGSAGRWPANGGGGINSSAGQRAPPPAFSASKEKPRCVSSGVLGVNPGDDLLSHGLSHTTIGAAAFHFRVRDGIGWFHSANFTRETVAAALAAPASRSCPWGGRYPEMQCLHLIRKNPAARAAGFWV